MAFRYFPTRNIDWLEAALERIEEEQVTGFISKVESEGVTGEKMQGLSVDERRSRILYDLGILDPETYPPEEYIPVTRTRGVF
jgi:hypothetical protein